jgi:hypothetical protein
VTEEDGPITGLPVRLQFADVTIHSMTVSWDDVVALGLDPIAVHTKETLTEWLEDNLTGLVEHYSTARNTRSVDNYFEFDGLDDEAEE